MESSEDRNRRYQREAMERQAEQRRQQERREDQRRERETEQKRRTDAERARTEAERHNRAMEKVARPVRSSSAGNRRAENRYIEPDYDTPRRRGGGKLVLLAILVAAIYFFWPQVNDAIKRSPVNDVRSEPQNSLVEDAINDGAETIDITPKPAQNKVKEYPPCSATVTDQCQQGS